MPAPTNGAKRVTIILRSLKDERGGYIHLLEELQRLGAAEATVFQGVASFVGQHPIHTNRVVDFVPELPVVIVWVDRADTVDAILPQVIPLIKDGIVTVDETTVALHTSTEIADLVRVETVGAVMTRDVTYVRRDTPISDMVELLVRRKFRALPVVDEAMRVVGIVTNGDLVRRGGLDVRMELLQAMHETERTRRIDALRDSPRTAGDIMTVDPVQTAEGASIREAAGLMLRHHLKRLPVVDQDQRLVGIVSRVDLLRTVTTPGVESQGNGAPAGHRAATAPISSVMSKDVPTVQPDDPVAHLINVIVSTRLNTAVVIDGERRPVGIVTDAELIERVTPEARESLLSTFVHRLPLVHESEEHQEVSRHAHGKAARDFVQQDFLLVEDNAPIGQVLESMLDQGRKVAVIVDADGVLRGMADRRDLLGALA